MYSYLHRAKSSENGLVFVLFGNVGVFQEGTDSFMETDIKEFRIDFLLSLKYHSCPCMIFGHRTRSRSAELWEFTLCPC